LTYFAVTSRYPAEDDDISLADAEAAVEWAGRVREALQYYL
jgi:hypothetical protein